MIPDGFEGGALKKEYQNLTDIPEYDHHYSPEVCRSPVGQRYDLVVEEKKCHFCPE
jgi:hypothetical protein